MFSKQKIHVPLNPSKEPQVIGMVIHYADKYGEKYEPCDLDACKRFAAKHKLETTDLQVIGKEMIKFFNKGLRPHDNKRKLMRVYITYSGVFYSSKKLSNV